MFTGRLCAELLGKSKKYEPEPCQVTWGFRSGICENNCFLIEISEETTASVVRVFGEGFEFLRIFGTRLRGVISKDSCLHGLLKF